MTTQELHTIFQKLLTQTVKKHLKWKAINAQALRIDFPRSSIIFKKTAPNNHPFLSILNSSGSEVAEITVGSLAPGLPSPSQLGTMWKAAFEIAYETDETVQDILSKLEGT